MEGQINALEFYRIKARSETYKEFAKDIKEEIKSAYDNNAEVRQEHLDKHEIPNPEFIGIITGKMNTLRGLDDFIDDLLKKKGAGKT